MAPALRYFFWLGMTVLTLVVATTAICVVADPYRFFDAPTTGWTALKPRAYQQSDLAKTYMLARTRPATILLGNSRVEVGLDPQSPEWPAYLRPVFNAALAGHDLFSALLFLQDDLALKTPKLAVVGLDFQDFIQAGKGAAAPPVGAAELRMMVDRNGRPNPLRHRQVLADALSSTLTIDALTDSLITLAQQNSSTGTTLTDRGFNPLHEYIAAVRQHGARSLFEQKEADYEKQYRTFKPADFAKPLENPEFHYLVAIIRACASHRVRLILFTYPYHSAYFALLHRAGLWRSFEAWKRALNEVVGQTTARTGGDVRLFDFAQESAFSNEPVPPANDRTSQLRWYWEAGHFKSALGEKIIARILQQGTSPLSFGHEMKLTANGVPPASAMRQVAEHAR